MVPPVRSDRAINYEDAFAYLFRRPGGWGKLAVGGVLILFSWLIVPLLVVLGYGVALGRMVAEGREELPQFELGMAADGLRAVVVTAGYLLPLFLAYVIAVIPMAISPDTGNDAAGGVFFVGGVLVFLVFMAYALAYALLQPAIFAVFIAEGSIGACFSPRRIRAVVTRWGGTYFAVAVILIGISQLVGFGFILFLIGIAFTYFYFMAVSAHFAGQLARPLVPLVPPSPPPSDWAGPAPAPPAPSTLSAPGAPAGDTAAGASTEEIAPLPSDTAVLEVPAEPSPPASPGKPPPSPAG